ncbi:hypothetical protein APTSU1_000868400 [Apodemus speciosus]|uniref:Uncharacterized protein n=1 Tax=Apodemus speciosus TaxID=105296 RepID=A0ABQ0F2P7_APOSI
MRREVCVKLLRLGTYQDLCLSRCPLLDCPIRMV